MSVRPILIWPSAKLSTPSKDVPVEDFGTAALQVVVSDLHETLEHAGGLGLSAIQVGIPYRVFVTNIYGEKHTYVNPVVMSTFGTPVPFAEGCLSVPGVFETVDRFNEIIVSSKSVEGEDELRQLDDVEAQCVAHEIDHLDGVMFVDRFGRVKKDIIKRKVAKALREARRAR